jgi:hypothetical protein
MKLLKGGGVKIYSFSKEGIKIYSASRRRMND